jgi:hypothetical protein
VDKQRGFSFLEERMRSLSQLTFAISLMFSSLVAQEQYAFSAWPHFSAIRNGGPIKRDPMKIYRSGNQMRVDHENPGEYQITKLDDRTSWMITPKQCTNLPIPDGPSYPFYVAYPPSDFKMERSPLEGEETIDGHKCRLENITFTQRNGPIAIKMKLWKAEDLDGYPVQIEVEPTGRAKFTLNYTNVSMQPPDPKLFQLPANCRATKPLGPGLRKKISPKAPKTAATQKSPQTYRTWGGLLLPYCHPQRPCCQPFLVCRGN